MLFGEMKILGTMSIKQLLFDDLSEIVLPADMLIDPQNNEVEVPKDPRFQIAKRMDIFVARAGQVTCAQLAVSISNRLTHLQLVVYRTLAYSLYEQISDQAHSLSYDHRLGQLAARRKLVPATTL